MRKFWSILFYLVPILGTILFLWSMLGIWPLEGHWLPEDMSRHGAGIDYLFHLILVLTGIIFIGTGVVLGWTLWRFGEDEANPKTAQCIHGSRALEATWSIIPGIVLVFLSIYQMDVWAEQKMDRPVETVAGVEQYQKPLCRVIARQFGWTFQYAGQDNELDTIDDVFSSSELCVPTGKEIVLQIESRDVLHSFFIPKLRLKQDIVPGMKQFCWFLATKEGTADIACTELCGWGHYKMKARLIVKSPEEFETWFEEKGNLEHADTFVPPVDEDDE